MRSLQGWKYDTLLPLPGLKDGIRHLPAVVSFVLIVTILVHAAGIASMWWHEVRSAADDGGAIPTTAVQAAEAREQDERRRLAQLLDAHVFGLGASELNSDAQPVLAPAEWFLSGTLRGPTPESGSAIVGQSRESARFHPAGQEVLAGYRLAQVFADRVMIEHAGQLLLVRLPRERLAFAAGPKVAATSSPGSAPANAPTPPGAGPRANPRLAANILRPVPYLSEGGHYSGMRVWGTGSGSGLLQLGLRRNDVITSVNGHPIDSSAAAQRALKELSSGEALKVTVERNGAPEDISLTFVDNRS